MTAKSAGGIVLLLIATSFGASPAGCLSGFTEKEIPLLSGPGFHGARGMAKIRHHRGEQEFRVEVEARFLANSTLRVWVNDTEAGLLKLDAAGQGQFDRKRGGSSTDPEIAPGALVGITNAGGDIVVAGKF